MTVVSLIPSIMVHGDNAQHAGVNSSHVTNHCPDHQTVVYYLSYY